MKIIFFTLILNLSPSLFAKDARITAIAKQLGCERDNMCGIFEKSIERDSLKNCLPSLAEVENIPQYLRSLKGHMKVVSGTFRYGGSLKGPYGYNVYWDGSKVRLESIIHFRADKLTPGLKKGFEFILDDMLELWTKENTFFDFPMTMSLKIHRDKRYAHVKNVDIVKGQTRGPYFKKWQEDILNFNPFHEVGHLFGLDDEYSSYFASSTTTCPNRKSAMCGGSGGLVTPVHYYLIFRRILCN